MAGFLALGNDRYIGTYEASEEVENGVFVELDHKEKTGALAGAGATDVYFVANENTNIDEFAIDDIDFKVAEGEFLRLYKPLAGNILVTSCFDGDLAVGDKVGIAAGGRVAAATEGEGLFVVTETTNELGAPTVRLLVL